MMESSRCDLRRATVADLDAIMVLETLSPPWSADSWKDEVDHHFVALAGRGEVHGVIAMSLVGSVAEVRRIIVDPSVRRTGIGQSLLSHGMEWAASHGAQEVFLEVSADNHGAIALYESHGFSPVMRRENYYGTDDDAVVYRWLVPGEGQVL